MAAGMATAVVESADPAAARRWTVLQAACPTSGAGVCGAPTLVVALWRQQAVVVRRTARSGSRFRSDASLVRSGVAWSPVVVIFDINGDALGAVHLLEALLLDPSFNSTARKFSSYTEV
ncbi:Os04g0483950 [Oryza sativa Japonica Group]|uniref:Os04g0483950 protein n=1 Tax=Oryza sativa subsp. japonica TaxID=39947 RepID=A0A0P0WBR6_ORYSJ|nr:Os04g0483950 [Oryza sativa Japonica Group]